MEISDVVNLAGNQYKLPITLESRQNYERFVKRQMEAHDYQIPASSPREVDIYSQLSLLIDKLLIFSYLSGNNPAAPHFKHPAILIKEPEQLGILRGRGNTEDNWADLNLWGIHKRRLYAKKLGMPTYVEIIEEAGQDPCIVELWGRPITYQEIRRAPKIKKVKYEGTLARARNGSIMDRNRKLSR